MAASVYGVGACTVCGISLTGVKNIRMAHTSTEQQTNSDGNLWNTLMWVEDVGFSGSVDTVDPFTAVAAANLPGKTGATTLVIRARASGSGYGVSKTYTISQAVLGNVEGSAPHSGESSASVPFRAYSSDGSTSPVAVA
jgi:hypothetical protein